MKQHNSSIEKITCRAVLDSRGNPTVEAEVYTNNGMGRASVPSGASTGTHEAYELRDGGKKFFGLGVTCALRSIRRQIAPKLLGMNCTEQEAIDTCMIQLDGTRNKKKLGANAILAVSLANARAAANSQDEQLHPWIAKLAGTKKQKLPQPFMNVINGGKHAGNNIAFQEYMIVPSAKKMDERIRIGTEVYHSLKNVIEKKYGKQATNVGDEGGFAPHLTGVSKAIENITIPLELLQEACEQAGHEKKVSFAIDAAATTFYDAKHAHYTICARRKTSEELRLIYERMIETYPIISLEDPFAEECFTDFAELTKRIGKKCQIVGDDLLVTNTNRIRHAIQTKACNALLLKINQIGTLTQALQAANMAKNEGWEIMVSNRSGETEDSFIADLAVGLGTGQIKTGAPCRGERTAKYNQLLRIAEEIE